MKKIWKRVICITMLFTLVVNFSLLSYASVPENRLYFGNAICDLENNTIEIPLVLEHNTGLMGFRISISYLSSAVRPVKVKRGSSLRSGMLEDSIDTANVGTFDVIWTGSSDYTEDGELCVVSFLIQEDRTDFSLSLGLSYSQDDTFNEKWQNVTLNCEPEKSLYITNGNVVNTRSSFVQKLLLFFRKLFERIKSIFVAPGE